MCVKLLFCPPTHALTSNACAPAVDECVIDASVDVDDDDVVVSIVDVGFVVEFDDGTSAWVTVRRRNIRRRLRSGLWKRRRFCVSEMRRSGKEED